MALCDQAEKALGRKNKSVPFFSKLIELEIKAFKIKKHSDHKVKDKFPGHFIKPAKTRDEWGDCIVVLDTNILLNLYRYSDETRDSFIKTLEKLKDRVWLPYTVAAEYIDRRLGVIFDQQQEYENAVNDINKLKSKLENARQHPFISKNTMASATRSLDKVINELENNKSIHTKRITSDEIQDFLAEMLNGKIGDENTPEELEKIITEGEIRYKQKTPPGYKDSKKQGDEDTLKARCRPYGDLIIWKSILWKANKDKKTVVFVTDDGKEDWWLIFKGKTLSPRPELIKEFKEETDQTLHMYLPERFLELAIEKNQEMPSEAVLDEIRDTRLKELNQHFENLKTLNISTAATENAAESLSRAVDFFNKNVHSKKTHWSSILKNDITFLKIRIAENNAKLNMLFSRLDSLKKAARNMGAHDTTSSKEEKERLVLIESEHKDVIIEISRLTSEREEMMERLDSLSRSLPPDELDA
ncbi:PIN-like domain-containing protein [Pseudomonas sediminis]|uniref:PIN-like domain-containing protein n=1 Tax=Pseudomonas sediminis TaxID=1691904 RepID=UPI0031CC5D22